MGNQYENRTFTRVSIEEPITVIMTDEGNKGISGTLKNISMIGLMVECDEQYAEGTLVEVIVAVDAHTTVELKATVMHADSEFMGLHTTGIASDGYDTLHELLLEHAEDEDAVRNEIFSLDHLAPKIY